MRIDLNADLGEGCASDSALLQLVFRQYRLRLSRRRCAAHAAVRARGAEKWRRYWRAPKLPGPGNFGRTAMQLPPETVLCPGAVSNWRAGGNRAACPASELRHVKPHGMLYNQAAKEPALADAIARAVRDADAGLVLVGLAGSELIRAGQRYQLTTLRKSSPIAVISPTVTGAAQPAGRADRERRAGAGANAGNGAAQSGAQPERRMGA